MKRQVKLSGISYSQSQVGYYTAILSEENGFRRVPVVVKTSDAQIIALRYERMTLPKPITQDVVKALTDSFNIFCSEIYIYKIIEGIFYSSASFNNGVDDTKVDIPIADAISMSFLYNCPLYVSEEILSTYGIAVEGGEIVENDNNSDHMSIEELQSILEDSLKSEDYEMAAQIRDKIAIAKSQSNK